MKKTHQTCRDEAFLPRTKGYGFDGSSMRPLVPYNQFSMGFVRVTSSAVFVLRCLNVEKYALVVVPASGHLHRISRPGYAAYLLAVDFHPSDQCHTTRSTPRLRIPFNGIEINVARFIA